MSRVVLIACLQACIFQLAYTQCIGAGYPNALNGIPPSYGLGPTPYGPSLETGQPTLPGSYGGTGVGDITVVGEMPVAGTTLVAGQVPILGAVRFFGEVPAGGVVSINGNCACGNNGFNSPF